MVGFLSLFNKNYSYFFFELYLYLFGFVVIIFRHNLLMLVFSIVVMVVAGIFFFFAASGPELDCLSASSLRKREIEVNLSMGGAVNLCMEYVDRLPSKRIISSNPDAGLIEVKTPNKFIPYIGRVQYILRFELEYVGVSKTDIKYSSRYAPGSSWVNETSMEGRNMEKLREIGSFFEKYRVSYKEK